MSDSDERDFAVGLPTATGGVDVAVGLPTATGGVANDSSAATPDSEELDFAGGPAKKKIAIATPTLRGRLLLNRRLRSVQERVEF